MPYIQTRIKRLLTLTAAAATIAPAAWCVPSSPEADTVTRLHEVVVKADNAGRRRLRGVATNTERIGTAELARAACCNLGESFTTNPSVDVSYADAATGARQIKLLGLSGQYVQMLTENVPNLRGAAAPYALGYVAGPWMQSIQVSKGASSVKNGYESVTGQINIEMRKPQADPSLALNAYVDQMGKVEANASASLHLGEVWSTALLAHAENYSGQHDGNGDGFADMPRLRQFAVMDRWARMGRNYVFQAVVRYIDEQRRSGQSTHHSEAAPPSTLHAPLFKIGIKTRRLEAFTKNAYIFDHDNDGNVALIVSGIMHNADASYGHRYYDVRQRELYAQLMFERKFVDLHSLSVGVNVNHDYYGERSLLTDASTPAHTRTRETVVGAYGQYTLNWEARLIVMAGLRYDHNSLFGSLVTPRMHLRYNTVDQHWSVNASAGLGRRTAHPLADYSYILASSRQLLIAGAPHQERAWNLGAGVTFNSRIGDRKVNAGADYYYTTFTHQTVLDLDADRHAAMVSYGGRGRSHALQLEAGLDILSDLNVTVAYRRTDVRQASTADAPLRLKPLTARNKGLLTAAWAPRMGLWQADATLTVTGGGRMPDGFGRYPAFCTLNAQVTRNWRHWAVYVGGENLTGYKQPTPIIDAANPWGPDFDATMIYAPLHGAVVYAGFRFNINLQK